MKNKLLLVGCVLFFTTIVFSQDYNFNTNLIPENLKLDANAVIRFEDLKIQINTQKSMTFILKKAVTVLNEMGDANKYVTISYDTNTKIRKLKTVIYNDKGTEIKKVRRSDFRDVSQVSSGTLYADNRLLYYEYLPLNYPYTIYYEYQIETVNTGFVPRWSPIHSYLTSIENSSYSIKTNTDLKVRTKEKNFEDFNILKNVIDNTLTFKLKNQEAIEKEPNSPRLDKFTPVLIVGLNKFHLEGVNGEANNWLEFGKWRYDYLNNGKDKINDATKLVVNNLVKGIEDPIEKAKVIYKFMQDRTRYISVQEGIGGWKPIAANTVHKLGYGDCKGLANYTKSLLDAVGVKSYYTVIWAGNEKKSIEKDFFSMQGNHIILNLPTDKEDIWLECTSQKVPFGYLGVFTDDRDALVVTPDGGLIKHTKIYKTRENIQSITGNFTVDSLGAINATLNIDSEGTQYIDNLQIYDGKSEKELDKLYKEYLSNINNIKFSKTEINNNRIEKKFQENLEFTATNYATIIGPQILLQVNAFNRSSVVPKRIRNRKLPFKISRGFVDLDEVKIQIPKNFSVEYLPKKVEVASKFGVYLMELSKMDDFTFLYKRKLQINKGNYEKEMYNDYRSFRKKIRKYDNLKIILKKNKQ